MASKSRGGLGKLAQAKEDRGKDIGDYGTRLAFLPSKEPRFPQSRDGEEGAGSLLESATERTSWTNLNLTQLSGPSSVPALGHF